MCITGHDNGLTMTFLLSKNLIIKKTYFHRICWSICRWFIISESRFLVFIVTDANRARRRRRQQQTVLNSGQAANPNPQTDARQLPLNVQGQQRQQQQPQQQLGQGGMGQNQGSRQYYGVQSCM